MTKFHFAFLSLVILLLSSCGGSLNQKGHCTVNIICDAPGYNRVYLYDLHNNPLDTTLYLEDGKVSFSRTDSADMPYLALLRFSNGVHVEDLELPIAIENGEVNVDLNETFNLSGTPLNDDLLSFILKRLNMIEKLDKEIAADTISSMDEKLEKIHQRYSNFYYESIVKNAGNPIGEFIYESYGHALNDADKEKVEQKLKKNL